MKIAPIAVEYISKPFVWISNNKYMKKACDKFEITPEKALAYTTIASIVGKDSIGCYMYVTQSLNNKEIPEEKRSFVAALDLTNGGLMIVSQLLMFYIFNKTSIKDKLFSKFFDKIFSNEACSKYSSYLRTQEEYKNLTKGEIWNNIKNIKERTKDTFVFLTSLVAATTIAKRVIVPFIATPMAGWAKDKFIDKQVKGDSVEISSSNTQSQPAQSEEQKESEFKGNLLDKFAASKSAKTSA